MRPLPLLLVALVLAGCAEPPAADGDAPGGDDPRPFLAYHARPLDEAWTNATVFAVRPDGSALRVGYHDDRSAEVRAAPGLGYPVEGLRVLFEPRGGNLNRSTGGVVLRVEEGRVPDAEFAALVVALGSSWELEPQDLDDPRGHDYVHFRRGGGVEVAREPLPPTFAPVAEAFADAERAFVVEAVHEGDPAPPVSTPPTPSGAGGCARTRIAVDPPTAYPGAEVRVTAEVENCGSGPLLLGETPCDAPHLFAVRVLDTRGRAWLLPPVPWAHPGMPPMTGCEGERPVVEVAPGGSATFTRAWDGRVLDCAGGEACEPRDVEPGVHTVVAGVDVEHGSGAQVGVTMLAPDGSQPTTLLVLARERAWVNRTQGEGWLRGDLGPHCAPAYLSGDPPTLTLWQGGGAPPDALVLRDLRPRPDNVSTVGEGIRVDALAPRATLRSAYDEARTLATVEARDGAVLVEGKPLAENETREARLEFDITTPEGSFRVVEHLTLTNMGRVPAFTREPGACA